MPDRVIVTGDPAFINYYPKKFIQRNGGMECLCWGGAGVGGRRPEIEGSDRTGTAYETVFKCMQSLRRLFQINSSACAL